VLDDDSAADELLVDALGLPHAVNDAAIAVAMISAASFFFIVISSSYLYI
jgi:hypothetical protein